MPVGTSWTTPLLPALWACLLSKQRQSHEAVHGMSTDLIQHHGRTSWLQSSKEACQVGSCCVKRQALTSPAATRWEAAVDQDAGRWRRARHAPCQSRWDAAHWPLLCRHAALPGAASEGWLPHHKLRDRNGLLLICSPHRLPHNGLHAAHTISCSDSHAIRHMSKSCSPQLEGCAGDAFCCRWTIDATAAAISDSMSGSFTQASCVGPGHAFVSVQCQEKLDVLPIFSHEATWMTELTCSTSAT